MADPYIDQFETQSYGPFAVSQVAALAMDIDAAYAPLFTHLTGIVTARTKALGALLERADDHVSVTYKPAPGAADPVADAVDVVRKLSAYASSRDDGAALADAVLGGRTITAIARLRPARLPEVLDTALKAVAKNHDALPEHALWTRRLRKALDAVSELNTRVRASRSARREMTPDIAAAREAWLIAYGALKLAVESALKLHGKLRLMPEIFDDLAEVHRASGVSDGDPPAPPAPVA